MSCFVCVVHFNELTPIKTLSDRHQVLCSTCGTPNNQQTNQQAEDCIPERIWRTPKSIYNNAYRIASMWMCARRMNLPVSLENYFPSIPSPHFILLGICFGIKMRMRKINIHLHIHLARLAHVKHVYARARVLTVSSMLGEILPVVR